MDRRKLNKVGCKGYNIDNKIIVSLYMEHGLTMKEIGDRLGISLRTVLARLKKEGVRKTVRHKINHSIFDSLAPECCYWGGFLAADGCVEENKVSVELADIDREHLKKLCRFVGRDEKLWNRERSRYGKVFRYSSVSLVSKKIVKGLGANFNIVPNKSLILRPPVLPNYLVNHYIRGYIDGDGCIGWHKSNNGPRLHIVSGSKEIINWIKTNIADSVEVGNPSILSRQNKHSIEYMGFQNYRILKWLYNNSTKETRLDRKYERYIKYLER